MNQEGELKKSYGALVLRLETLHQWLSGAFSALMNTT